MVSHDDAGTHRNWLKFLNEVIKPLRINGGER